MCLEMYFKVVGAWDVSCAVVKLYTHSYAEMLWQRDIQSTVEGMPGQEYVSSEALSVARQSSVSAAASLIFC